MLNYPQSGHSSLYMRSSLNNAQLVAEAEPQLLQRFISAAFSDAVSGRRVSL